MPHAAVMQSHDRLESRWQPGLARFGITHDKWRRHRLQLSLTRAHAWLVALDDHIIRAFEGLCESLPDAKAGSCFSGILSVLSFSKIAPGVEIIIPPVHVGGNCFVWLAAGCQLADGMATCPELC